ncbi:PqqD family protein [Sphingobacterium bovistauri]|uniref:PqqD family protein n=1 Tax=Sphingobacterium bovistauri TaxID=2781959 RepID=A0ABS7Z2C5_9SPHI|nr:PqqD family protein [Sphingobacterium bovistauri]MCA5004128.1 PqqD family protein [Sphingobacterium bovistauri]
MKLKEGLIVRKVGEDYVIVAPEQGMVDLSKVYSLNETAAWLWEALDGKDFQLNDMVELVRSQYDVNELTDIQLISDMEELVLFFRQNDLLES